VNRAKRAIFVALTFNKEVLKKEKYAFTQFLRQTSVHITGFIL